jgi:hypothetical protein
MQVYLITQDDTLIFVGVINLGGLDSSRAVLKAYPGSVCHHVVPLSQRIHERERDFLIKHADLEYVQQYLPFVKKIALVKHPQYVNRSKEKLVIKKADVVKLTQYPPGYVHYPTPKRRKLPAKKSTSHQPDDPNGFVEWVQNPFGWETRKI